MKRAFISISMMLMMLMASAQQVVNVEFLDGDLDNDDKITTGDVTGLIDYYLNDEEPRKTVTVTVDNSELEAKIARNTEWIDYFIKNQYDGINEDKVREIVEEYIVANPGLTRAEVDGMIDKAIAAAQAEWREGITPAEAELLVTKAIQDALEKYEASHPSGMTAAETALAINDALKDVALKSDVPTAEYINSLILNSVTNVFANQQQTINELKATIEELKAEINNLKNASK